MKISLISVCYDRAAQLAKCLPLWLAQQGAFKIHENKADTGNDEGKDSPAHKRGRPRNKPSIREVVEDTSDKKDIPR